MKTNGIAATVLALSTFCSIAQAENSKFRAGELSVIPAGTILASGTDMRFSVGENLEFLKATDFPADASVSVRLFALPATGRIPARWNFFDPCSVFVSVLEKLVLSPKSPIKLFKITRNWLDSSNGSVKEQRYLVVFERGDSDGDEVLRLNGKAAEDYFAQGIVIVMAPEGPYTKSEIEDMANRSARRSAEGHEAANKNSSGPKCYKIKVPLAGVPGAPRASNQYELSDCEPEVAVY